MSVFSNIQINLPPFAMWTAFPSSDYYGGSATELPHRYGIIRHGWSLSIYPCKYRYVILSFDKSTQFGFPGSLDNTQTFSLRLHL